MARIDIHNTSRKYEIIYADPPWNYRQKGGKNGRGAAEKHYTTMQTADICALPVPQIAAENSILFIWATFPNIKEALKVIDSWGFEYKTAAFVWVKKNKKNGGNFMGMGAYTRANAEICLLAIKRGTKAKQIVKSHAVHQIIESPIEAHSKKPDIVREKITELLGGELSRIELFARRRAPEWDCWGNEV